MTDVVYEGQSCLLCGYPTTTEHCDFIKGSRLCLAPTGLATKSQSVLRDLLERIQSCYGGILFAPYACPPLFHYK